MSCGKSDMVFRFIITDPARADVAEIPDYRIICRVFEEQLAVRILRVYLQSRKPLDSDDFNTDSS